MSNGNKDIEVEDMCCKIITIAQRVPKSILPQELLFTQQNLIDNVPNASRILFTLPVIVTM